MPFDRFLIAPLSTGLQTDLHPWLIPDDAFAQLRNAYVFRGRVRKRFGSRLMGSGYPSLALAQLFSRVRINLGNTDGSGNASGTVPGMTFQPGQLFSIGNEIFTVPSTGTPVVMLTTGSSTTHTYNTSNGAYVFAGAAPTTAIWFYPATPIMGLTVYERGSLNNQPSYAFDTQFAYIFSGGFWQRSGTAIWHGNNLNFFWTCNWDGITPDVVVLFVTNFNATIGTPGANDDPIWWTTDGSTWISATGTNAFYFLPSNMARYTGPYVKTCRIIVAFKNRLLLLNTVENNNPNHDGTAGTNTSYVNRCRYSHNGSPFAQNAWYEQNQMDSSGSPNNTSIADGAGFIDATTEEAIISAEFIKDRLIVYFEKSTWELAYTGNEILPFVWQKINTELGSESQQSTVPFDKVILTIGNTGVHACNGANVERIDNKIPDEVFSILDKNIGVQRVAGIRDYFVEMVYWTFPSSSQNPNEVYPTQVLVYNYKNGSWALNDDCLTAFGYFEQQNAQTWASSETTWEQSEFIWSSGTVQANFRQVIAGNQQGFVFIIDPEEGRNAPAMQITAITTTPATQLTIIDHTLAVGDYICIENAQGVTGLNGNIYQVSQFIDINNVVIIDPLTNTAPFTGTYTGGGTVTRVSNIQILSKQWNPYDKTGRNFYLARIDFGVLKTADGQITVDYYPSATELSMLDQGGSLGTNSNMGTGVLETSPYNPIYYPLEQVQDRLWHPIYFQTDGECIQIYMYFTPAQIINSDIAWSDFELEGLVLHTQATSARLQ